MIQIKTRVMTDIIQNQKILIMQNLRTLDILKNLDQKLAHLDQSQRHELKQLIHEYEHLFPDIPTHTDKIYHDVVIEDS